jgi:hypothetical protein
MTRPGPPEPIHLLVGVQGGTDRRHLLAVGTDDHDRALLRGLGHRQAALERLHVAALFPVQVLGRPDRDRQPEDRPESLDGLGVGVVDDEGPQPLLEQVGVLPPGQMQPGVQRCGLEAVVAVADPLDGDVAEDGEVGAGPGRLQAWQDLRSLRGGRTGDRERRPHVAITGAGQERPEQASPIFRTSRKMTSST